MLGLLPVVPLINVYMRVLVVEDEWLIADDMSHALQDAGHQVIGPASSSTQALVLAASAHPELALIDIDLEKRGIGLNVAQRLHDDQHIPVVLVTGQSALARSCRYAVGLISKPYDATQAAAAVAVVEEVLASGRVSSGRLSNLEIFETTVAQLRGFPRILER